MADSLVVFTLIAIVAIAAALLTWVAIDVGTGTLKRYRATFTERAKFQAQEFFLFIDPSKLFIANLGVMLLGSVATLVLFGNPIFAGVAFCALALLPRWIYKWLRKRRLAKFEEQLPDALMMLCGGMRAGVGLNTAIAQLVAQNQVPISQEFSLVLREQRLGVTLEQSLNSLGRRVPTQTVTLVVSAMRIAAETGGGLAETLERTAQTVRSRLQMEGKIGALTSQGKLQAWVVGLLPIVLMAVLNKMEPEAMGMLWHSPIGWGVLTVIGMLEFMGIYVIRRIIAIDV